MPTLPQSTVPLLTLPLADLALIRASGEDAITFLHGQLTNSIADLNENTACLAGYCSPKGRLLSTMIVWRSAHNQIDMLVKADIADSILKRLRMFVLRAKVLFERVDGSVYGQLSAPDENAASWQHAITGATHYITAPSLPGHAQRTWCITPSSGAPSSSPQDVSAKCVWDAYDILGGLPWITPATQDMFIPQTVNLDLIGGVNFTKGCYPGQEVVARAHYRGTVKRRMAYGTVAATGATDYSNAGLAAIDTFNAKFPNTPCGRVINAARVDSAALNSLALAGLPTPAALSCEGHVLMEVTLADLPNTDFRLGSANGESIQVKPLPYHLATA